MARTGLVAPPGVQCHDPGVGHPESPQRFDAVMQGLELANLLAELQEIELRSASEDELALVHSREYLALVDREVTSGRSQLSTGDTDVNGDSAVAARLAAGAVLSAVDAVQSGHTDNAFCVVRPPGHHASQSRGMGFCLFNTVAVAARYAQRKHALERVAIVDWDVHHGNGTQDIFYRDGSVLFFSTHQSPWYPGTGPASEAGEEEGAGTTINCPLPAGSGQAEIFTAFRERLLPALNEFRPDLILLSAGFDSRLGDPLGQFRLTDQNFADLTEMVLEAAGRYCGGRLVSVLEGGYNLAGLAAAAAAHVRTLRHGSANFQQPSSIM